MGKTSMNILYYLHQFPAIGGIETVTATLANYFVGRGHGVTIVSHVAKSNADKTVALDSRVVVLKMPDTEGVTKRNQEFLRDAVKERKIDVVVFQDSYAEIDGNLALLKSQGKVVSVEHNAPYFLTGSAMQALSLKNILRNPRRFLGRCRRAFRDRVRRRFLYDFADRYVLLSNRFFGEFRMMAGLGESHKLRAIPNPMAAQLQTAERPKQKEIVFCATLTNLKGCDMLLEVWAMIADVEKDWRLTIVGDGPQRGELEAFVQARNLPRIKFVGYQSDPSPYFARAKVLAFPSRREGWGLVLVEAMANGCVPVAFDSYGAVHDIIDDGVNGFVVPAFDLGAFAASLRKLMDDANVCAEMQNAAKCKPMEFAVEKVAAKWEQLFAELLGGGGAIVVVCEHSCPYY